MEKTIGQILLEKLTSEELSELCDAFDEGRLDDIFYDELLGRDVENNPKKYVDPIDESYKS